jgi:hypothetical protein
MWEMPQTHGVLFVLYVFLCVSQVVAVINFSFGAKSKLLIYMFLCDKLVV